MTQKEKLYFEYLTIQNSIYAAKGESEKQLNLDEFCNTGRFCAEARNSKVFELEQMVQNANSCLQRVKREAARKAWFETPEGMQYKQEKEAELKALLEQERDLRNAAYEYTRKVVQTLLGAHFDVTSFSNTSMTIGLVKSYMEDGRAEAHFGHTFEVYYDNGLWGDKYRWELNYGCMGGFDLDEDNSTRTQYLVGLAKFAANKTLVPALRDYLHGYVKSAATLRNAYYDAKHELENPAALAA